MSITRSFIQSHRSWLFIYGDNLIHRGYGGQAKECRGESNTIGIPTKRFPSMSPLAFFSDEDFESITITMDHALFDVNLSSYEKIIVLPHIGEGRAQLPQCAPFIYKYLVKMLNKLKEKND